MARTRFTHNSFATGFINKNIQGNSEFEQYNNALAKCVNFYVLPTGGVQKRAGSIYITTLINKKCKLIPYIISRNENYMLLFSDKKLQIFTKYGELDVGSSLELTMFVLDSNKLLTANNINVDKASSFPITYYSSDIRINLVSATDKIHYYILYPEDMVRGELAIYVSIDCNNFKKITLLKSNSKYKIINFISNHPVLSVLLMPEDKTEAKIIYIKNPLENFPEIKETSPFQSKISIEGSDYYVITASYLDSINKPLITLADKNGNCYVSNTYDYSYKIKNNGIIKNIPIVTIMIDNEYLLPSLTNSGLIYNAFTVFDDFIWHETSEAQSDIVDFESYIYSYDIAYIRIYGIVKKKDGKLYGHPLANDTLPTIALSGSNIKSYKVISGGLIRSSQSIYEATYIIQDITSSSTNKKLTIVRGNITTTATITNTSNVPLDKICFDYENIPGMTTEFDIDTIEQLKYFSLKNNLFFVCDKGIYVLSRTGATEFTLTKQKEPFTIPPLTFLQETEIYLNLELDSPMPGEPVGTRYKITPVDANGNTPSPEFAPVFFEEDKGNLLVLLVNYESKLFTYYLNIYEVINNGGFNKITAYIDEELSPYKEKDNSRDYRIPEIAYKKPVENWQIGCMNEKRGWPTQCELFEGRLFVANTQSYDLGLWASNLNYGDLLNFNIESNSASGLQKQVRVEQAGEILWLCAINKLFIGTLGGVCVVGSGTYQDEGLTPEKFVVRLFDALRPSALQPAKVKDAIFFVDQTGANVYEIVLDSSLGAYRANNVSLLANELTKSGIVEHTFLQSPVYSYWTALKNGHMAQMTYQKNNNILAWSEHVMAGLHSRVESLCALPNDDKDALWMVVSRTINNRELISLEYMPAPYDPIIQDSFKQIFSDSCVIKELKRTILNIINSTDSIVTADFSFVNNVLKKRTVEVLFMQETKTPSTLLGDPLVDPPQKNTYSFVSFIENTDKIFVYFECRTNQWDYLDISNHGVKRIKYVYYENNEIYILGFDNSNILISSYSSDYFKTKNIFKTPFTSSGFFKYVKLKHNNKYYMYLLVSGGTYLEQSNNKNSWTYQNTGNFTIYDILAAPSQTNYWYVYAYTKAPSTKHYMLTSTNALSSFYSPHELMDIRGSSNIPQILLVPVKIHTSTAYGISYIYNKHLYIYNNRITKFNKINLFDTVFSDLQIYSTFIVSNALIIAYNEKLNRNLKILKVTFKDFDVDTINNNMITYNETKISSGVFFISSSAIYFIYTSENKIKMLYSWIDSLVPFKFYIDRIENPNSLTSIGPVEMHVYVPPIPTPPTPEPPAPTPVPPTRITYLNFLFPNNKIQITLENSNTASIRQILSDNLPPQLLDVSMIRASFPDIERNAYDCGVLTSKIVKIEREYIVCDNAMFSIGDKLFISEDSLITPTLDIDSRKTNIGYKIKRILGNNIYLTDFDNNNISFPNNIDLDKTHLYVYKIITINNKAKITLGNDTIITVKEDTTLPSLDHAEEIYINTVWGIEEINNKKYKINTIKFNEKEKTTELTLYDLDQSNLEKKQYAPLDTVNKGFYDTNIENNGNLYDYFDFIEIPHLRGSEVVIMSNGNFIGTQVVGTSGIITLDEKSMYCVVGLQFTSSLQTVSFSGGSQIGSSIGGVTSQKDIILSLYNSLGGKYGTEFTNMYPIPYARTIELDKPAELFTGLKKLPVIKSKNIYERSTCIEHSEPVNFTLLALTEDTEVSDG